MITQLRPHLYFQSECHAAMTHYQGILGGELDVVTFDDLGMAGDPGDVLHATLRLADGLILTAGDVTVGSPARTGGSISITADDETTLRTWFDALADTGEIHMPLERQPWGELFGQCADRFAVTWLFSG